MTMLSRCKNLGAIASIFLIAGSLSLAEERTQNFDRDPGWESINCRPPSPVTRTIKQDFGYSPQTKHAGGQAGEIGGFITPAAEPAYYAKKLKKFTFADKLSASGTLACSGQRNHFLIGFFNSATINEWRTPNTIALRISPRGDIFLAWLEYATSLWRAGGDSPLSFPTERNPKTGRQQLKGFPSKGVHHWSLQYDPNGNGGRGEITATIDGVKAVCNVAAGHKADGAVFDRFGILNVMKSADSPGEVWINDVTINGEKEDFSRDPQWEGVHNHRSYTTSNIRPRFDFGYSPTQFAGGQAAGEMGGLIFRGDCRFADKMASYADRLNELTLEKPIRCSGKMCMKRGVTDSTVLIGFFNAKESMALTNSQDTGLPPCFLGISTDGPSREGFLFSPTYRTKEGAGGNVRGGQPHIYPDGKSRDWSMTYDPAAAGGLGEITVTVDDKSVRLPLGKGHKTPATKFNRFGIITTWIDGNSQTLYFDDLTYTCKQD